MIPGAAAVTPADAVEIRTLRFTSDGTVPNNPDLPVLLMRGALGTGAAPSAVTARIEASDWRGTWVWQVFGYNHYHPNAHEALAVASGRAVLMLGGPQGEEVDVTAGDVVVLPAGTGQEEYETIRAEHAHDGAVRDRIAAVALPRTDPVYGAEGPLVAAWNAG